MHDQDHHRQARVTDTVPPVAPRSRGLVPPAIRDRLLAARAVKGAADQEMRAAVLAALAAGGSVREVAELSGLSTNTVQRWKPSGDPTDEEDPS